MGTSFWHSEPFQGNEEHKYRDREVHFCTEVVGAATLSTLAPLLLFSGEMEIVRREGAQEVGDDAAVKVFWNDEEERGIFTLQKDQGSHRR